MWPKFRLRQEPSKFLSVPPALLDPVAWVVGESLLVSEMGGGSWEWSTLPGLSVSVEEFPGTRK